MMDDPVQCYRISSNFRMLGSLPIEDVELYLTVCGTERCTSDKFYGPIVRRDYHVHFVLSGRGILEMDGKIYHPHRGQIFVTMPGVNLFIIQIQRIPGTMHGFLLMGQRHLFI